MKTEQPILMYLLLTLFIGLKLTGNINWSWVWVLAPLWGGFAGAIIFGFVAGFYRAVKHTDNTTEGKGGSKV